MRISQRQVGPCFAGIGLGISGSAVSAAYAAKILASGVQPGVNLLAAFIVMLACLLGITFFVARLHLIRCLFGSLFPTR